MVLKIATKMGSKSTTDATIPTGVISATGSNLIIGVHQ